MFKKLNEIMFKEQKEQYEKDILLNVNKNREH